MTMTMMMTAEKLEKHGYKCKTTEAQTFHLPRVKISIIAPSSNLMRILIGLFAWRAMIVVVGDGDGDVAEAALFGIRVIIADVIINEIRNKIRIYETIRAPPSASI